MKTTYLPLTAILVPNTQYDLAPVTTKNNGYTAYFKQFKEIIAEGDTEEEAIDNLLNAVYDVFIHKNKDTSGDYYPGKKIQKKEITISVN